MSTTETMTILQDPTIRVLDVATNAERVPMIAESTINLVGWVCALVYQDAEFRIYRVQGSTNSSLDGDGLAVGVRVYKYNRTISEWLLCCWTHVVANNPQMEETFPSWFKRRTTEQPTVGKRRDVSSFAPTPRRAYTPAPSSYPSRTYTPAKPAPAPDELDGMVGEVGKRVVTKL